MTVEELENANNINRKLERFIRYEKFSRNFAKIDNHSKTSMKIQMADSTNWELVIDEDDTELIRELFETMQSFTEKRIVQLTAQFSKL